MQMRTITKIRLAHVLYKIVSTGRSVIGWGDHVSALRGGIQWDLDLREGIDFSIYVLGVFERSTNKALKRLIKTGDTVLDIGANIGAHTLHLAKFVGPQGRVFAFEPTDYAYNKLVRNLALNPALASVVTAEQIMLTAAPSDKVPSEFYSSWPLKPDQAYHEIHCGKSMSASKAAGESLDDYVRRQSMTRIDVIKMDVDGHEMKVLLGARESLMRFRPRIVAEIAPYTHEEEGSSFNEFIELLKDLKYLTYGENQNRRLDAAHLLKRVPEGQSINVLLVPERI